MPRFHSFREYVVCHAGGGGQTCEVGISLETTGSKAGDMDMVWRLTQGFSKAFEDAIAAIGWRRLHGTDFYCPVHAENLVCDRCGSRECSCMGGPRLDARYP